MKPSAVLLIDLENFFCSREDFCRKSPSPNYDRDRFRDDLDKLLVYARAMTGIGTAELPFTVRRAYADFNVMRYAAGGPPQYYLRQIPEEVLSQGVEPVQVFRLSRGGKNAADMKMAMDATSLLFTGPHVEHFVLVTGDADFIPVILELKRHGRTVSVIGVTGATSPKIQRFVDNFELFEDLLAAEEVETRGGELLADGDGIAPVAAAVHRLLSRSHPLRFAAVKPLLSKELGHPFDPGLFGCDTTGDFLRNHQAALGIVVRQGLHDSEIDLPNGSANGSRVGPKPPARAIEKSADKPAKGAAPEPHTAAHYRQLLTSPRGAAASREGKVYGVPWSVLAFACDAVVPLLAPPTGEPTASIKLLPKLVAAAETWAIPNAVKHVRLFYPTLRAGLPAQSPDGTYALQPDATGDQIRGGVLRYIAYVLGCRLAEGGVVGDPRPDQLAAVFEPGAALDRATAEFAAALAEPAAPPEPEPPKPVGKPAVAEEFHTAAGYQKLLKAGGAKGSDTETFKVLPVPWPSVERICADAFDLLNPATGGPLPRDQFTAKLIAAGKDLYAERYDQHVRRALGVLRLAGDLIESDDVMSLGADVTSGYDLRGRALAYMLGLLQLRLEERGVYDPIRPQAFVAALEAGPLSDQLAEEVAPAIEWLYRPEDAPPATGEEPPLAMALELPPDAPAQEPVPADAYTFDGVLPEIDTGNDPLPPEVRHGAEVPPIAVAAFAPVPADPSSGDFSVIDVAAITSAAVAAAAEAPDEPITQPIMISDLAPVAPPDPTGADGGVAVLPAADWLADGDSVVLDLDAAEVPLALPVPEPESVATARLAPPPLPAFELPDELAPEVDKMSPPPAPRRVVPPPLPPIYPPVPPESA